jgi:hypothetical protein
MIKSLFPFLWVEAMCTYGTRTRQNPLLTSFCYRYPGTGQYQLGLSCSRCTESTVYQCLLQFLYLRILAQTCIHTVPYGTIPYRYLSKLCVHYSMTLVGLGTYVAAWYWKISKFLQVVSILVVLFRPPIFNLNWQVRYHLRVLVEDLQMF